MIRLETGIRRILKPILIEHGFLYDNYLTFRKIFNDKVYIINFQKGRGSLTGHFTVNIALYTPETYEGYEENLPTFEKAEEIDCKYEWRVRLGATAEIKYLNIVSKLFGVQGNWLKSIFSFKEKWWETPLFEDDMSILLNKIAIDIVKKGIPWLEKIET